MMETVEELRASGNELFKEGKFAEAVEKYSDALAIEPANHLLYSNRSLAQCSAGKWKEATEDAEKCISLDEKFMKGYYRLANALSAQDKFDDATVTIRKGLALEPDNPELKKMLRVIAAKRETARRGKRAAQRGAPDEDTRKQIQDLSEQLTLSQREMQETSGRIQACKRELQRGQFTTAEIDGLDDKQELYRSIGKMFVRRSKPQVQTLLKEQAQHGTDRVSALTSRYAILERNVNSMQSELQSMTAGITA